MYKRIGLALFSFIFSTASLAHGEDALGPHKGYVKMPGAYHVEVVPGENKIDIILLDINFKNPTVLNSYVKAQIKSRNSSYSLECEALDNHFSCPVSSRLLAKKGSLYVESERQLAEGTRLEYALPLRLGKK